jgi:hypothetical protein
MIMANMLLGQEIEKEENFQSIKIIWSN